MPATIYKADHYKAGDAMKSNLVSVFTLAISVTFLTACGEKEQTAEVAQTIRPVKTLVIESPESGSFRRFPARVEAANRATLSFQVSGKLQEILVKESEKVKTGQVLARLDPQDYQIKVNDRTASYQQAAADFNRAKGLVDKGHVSKSDFDKLEANFKSARAALEKAKNDLDYTELKAPFDGSISKRLVENFEQVNAQQTILELRDLETLEIKFDVPENIVQRIKRQPPNQARESSAKRVYAMFEGLPDKRFELSFKEAATQADEKTQTFEVTFTMPHPKELQILPGMTANVEVNLVGIIDIGKTHYLVPADAVVSNNQLDSVVWVVDPQTMTLSSRSVKVGKMHGHEIEIFEGLESGERIVVAGVAYLTEGMKVTLMPTPEQAQPRMDDPS